MLTRSPSATFDAAVPSRFIKTKRQSRDAVQLILKLARNLNLRAVAEGVETDLQVDRLRELGCTMTQGYLFSRPSMPAAPPTLLPVPQIPLQPKRVCGPVVLALNEEVWAPLIKPEDLIVEIQT